MFKPVVAESQDLAGITLQQARQLLRSKAVSPVDLTRACLMRIERCEGKLNAFITVTGERALADARAMEAELAHGKWRVPLLRVRVADRTSDHRRSIRGIHGIGAGACIMSAKQHGTRGIAGNYATSGGPTYCISYRANTSASIFGPFGTAT